MTYWDFAHQNPALALAYAVIAFLAVVIVVSLLVARRLVRPQFSAADRDAVHRACAKLRWQAGWFRADDPEESHTSLETAVHLERMIDR